MRYGIHLCYKGTNYAGWQIQPNAVTVQEEIEKVLKTLLKEQISITGCGRTDTGVHASSFYAHFNYNGIFDLDEKKYQCNSILNKDISIYKFFEAQEDWHARFSATERTYRYIFATHKNPFLKEFSWQIPYTLDFKKMEEAALKLKLYEDFTSFARLHGGQSNNICKIHNVRFIEDKDSTIFEISANRFLRNMVRAIVGTLVDIGRGQLNIEDFENIIKQKDRSLAGSSAPAKALFLYDIKYE